MTFRSIDMKRYTVSVTFLLDVTARNEEEACDYVECDICPPRAKNIRMDVVAEEEVSHTFADVWGEE